MAKKSNSLGWVLVIVFAILLIGAFYLSFQQTIFSSSQVKLINGKVYWLISGSANNIDEGYNFFYNVGNQVKNYELPDGSVVSPQKSMYVTISKGKSYCKYNLINKGSYDVLSNPERIVEVEVTDSNGVSKIIDGTIIQSITLKDPDGDGSVVIETQGILGSKLDCPESSDVAIIYKDGQEKFVSKNDLLESTGFGILDLIYSIFKKIDENTAFINGFENMPIRQGGAVIGDVNIGNVVYTLTADQGYFDSIIYSPPKEANPKIDSINLPSKILANSNQGMSVKVINLNDDTGLVSVSADSVGLSITPSSQNINLKGTKTLNFNVRSISNKGNYKVCVNACSVSQFNSENCDSKCVNFEIYESSTPDPKTAYCGDDVCQSSESYTTCPADCKITNDDIIDSDLKCNIFQTKVETKELHYKLWNYFGIGEPESSPKVYCATAGWVYLVILLVFLTIILLFIYYKLFNKKKRRK